MLVRPLTVRSRQVVMPLVGRAYVAPLLTSRTRRPEEGSTRTSPSESALISTRIEPVVVPSVVPG